jgi:hypothetical protein
MSVTDRVRRDPVPISVTLTLIDKLDAVGRTDAVAHAARRGVIQL